MDFGMPTLIECPELTESIMLCKKLKLQFVELNMNLPQYQINQIDIAKAKMLLNKNDIYCTIHLEEAFNVCDFNSEVANAYLKTALSAIDISKQLDVPIINMHMPLGVYFTLPDKRVYLFSEYEQLYLERLTNFRDCCDSAIGRSSIKICVENCDGHQAFQIKGINLLLESENFGLTYDIGHAYTCGFVDEEFTLSHKSRLNHMHIHDGLCGKNHLALGHGEIDIKRYLKLAQKLNCRCVLETKTIKALETSVEWLNL